MSTTNVLTTNVPTPTMAAVGPKAPDYREIYSNVSRVAISPWDLRLVFGQTVEGATQGQLVMQDVMTVVISPQHAKILLESWTTAMKTYETHFGEVPNLTAAVNAFIAKQT